MIKITAERLDKVKAYLAQIPHDVINVTLPAIAKYLVGNEQHGLKHYPPYKHVPWASIGGWRSEKQRRYVMAKIKSGEIVPGVSASTGQFRNSWVTTPGEGRYVIQNTASYSKYLVGNFNQATRPRVQGWRVIAQNVMDNMVGAMYQATLAVKRYLKGQAKG